MNKENFEKVARLVENNPKHFDMKAFATVDGFAASDEALLATKVEVTADGSVKFTGDCKTVGCFAGFACMLSIAEGDAVVTCEGCGADREVDIEGTASAYLGITEEQAVELFYEPISEDEYVDLEEDKYAFDTPQDYANAAARRLREFANQNE